MSNEAGFNISDALSIAVRIERIRSTHYVKLENLYS
eukprot:UN03054